MSTISLRAALTAGALTIALTGLTACSNSTSDNVTTSGAATATASAETSNSAATSGTDYIAPRTMADGMGSGEADGVFPRTVKHFQGETTIEAEPQRVVVISTGQIDGLLTLGVVPAGTTAPSNTETVPQYLRDAFPDLAEQFDDITYVGSRTEPSIEDIASLNPDLILINNAGKKDSDGLYESLTAIAPTVVTEGTGVNWKSDFLLLADALGRIEQAQGILDDYHEKADQLATEVDPDETVSFLTKNGDRIRVYGVSSFSGSIAEDAGISRPESQSFTDETSLDISSEELAQADGTWLFYGVNGGDNSELESLPLWNTLEAVTTNHAVAVDNDPFYLNAGPTAANLVLSTLSERLGK
ncbi:MULTISPECIES: iron-siderophore ABC transporter substrate-binding protein [unclassified Actinobaculum]|uniref:ABC transporter substrate-binding protein n=1 Tax=unclassified Actinobaculum TaxID=2609299 RepID=UPI000D525E11|nr:MULTISPECIES: iron-siderophore ABC transporter substrate-binding protein [unclassified Actinobaculum]AWE41763.1 iron-siderophore ABC transporter substrate-binding protein [Actinobaculum sp. 313]RTE50319.1 iron-siderophore ABC transporter substrate-binding protein [Actinobaculum sp. 352]